MLGSVLTAALLGAPAVFAAPAPAATPAPGYAAHYRRHISELAQVNPRGFTSDEGVVHVPISARRSRPSDLKRRLAKRQSSSGYAQVGLSDDQDNAYIIALDLGGQAITFQIDTGSSDTWATTDACNTVQCDAGTQSQAPRYDPTKDSTWESYDISTIFNYGTSAFPRNATGVTGSTTVTLGGMALQNATITAVNETNNNVARDSAGIFGVSFGILSNAAREIFIAQVQGRGLQNASVSELTTLYENTTTQYGGALYRLARTGRLAQPGFSITLQRFLDLPTSNAGLLTIGGLPSGIQNSSLTYVPVTPYPGNVWSGFSFLQNTLGPAVFGIPLDGVTVNGQTLRNSTNGTEVTSQVGVLALIDSGTTAVSGPPDLVADIYQAVGYNETDETVPCDVNFQMSLEFGGKQFPINPLDWVQVTSDTLRTGRCNFLLQSGDVPSAGDYTSWIFGKLSRFLDATFVLTQSSPSGDVFMKNVVSYFSYGSADGSQPAAIGLLSTTDAQAAEARYQSLFPSSLSGLPGTTLSTTKLTAGTATTSIGNPISALTSVLAAAPSGGGGGSGGSGGGSSRASSGATPSGSSGASNSAATNVHPGFAFMLIALIAGALCV